MSNNFLRPLVVSGPSGVGKGTLIQKLLAEYPSKFRFSISHTTRQPRQGEQDGREYHFVSRSAFEKLLPQGPGEAGEMLEHAQFAGNYYGTSKQAVQDVQSSGQRCILDIESEGVKQVKLTDLNAVFVFICPPTMSELRKRLEGRKSETQEVIDKRLATAIVELDFAKTGPHDYIVINSELDLAYEAFKRIALSEPLVGPCTTVVRADLPDLDY